MKKKKSLLFIVDPWETLDHSRDTTLRLIEEALSLGARCSIAVNHSIGLDQGVPHAEVRTVTKVGRPRTAENVSRSDIQWTPLAKFDHIFYRTDPPVDLAYLLPLQILASTPRLVKGKGPKIHTSPAALFSLNEKWAPAELGSLFPSSLVSASTDRLVAFLAKTGKAVLKPLYLAQSRGVQILDGTRMNSAEARNRFDTATQGGLLPVILQAYLPGIIRGETRIWFVAGKSIAAVKKLPKSGEFIINMDRGGTLARVTLDRKEKAASEKIGKFLTRHSILFAAVDLIDGKVTDFNHTSPGLLVAMEDLLGENLARKALRPILRG